jgi:transglutaminase-like putative cysteine protease
MFVFRLGNWMIRKLGQYTILTLICLSFVIVGTAVGFSSAVRGISFGPLLRLGLTALLLGWLLARTKIPTWLAGLLLLLFGAGISFVTMASLWEPLLFWLHIAASLAWNYLKGMRGEFLDLIPIQLASSDVGVNFSEAWLVFEQWGRSIIAGKSIFEGLAVSMVWGLVMWLISAWAGWVQRKYARPMVSILPAGLLLAISLAYTFSEPVPLYYILIGILPLIALTSFYTNQHRWNSTGMDYPEDTSTELTIATIVISVVLIAGAIIIPRLSIRAIAEFVHELTTPQQWEQTERVFQSFGLEQKVVESESFKSAISGGMPRRHLVGSGPELSEQLVMQVRLTGGMSVYALQDLKIPLYWRSLTYDYFTGVGWRSSKVSSESYRASETALSGELPHHWVLQQDVRLIGKKGPLIYSAGELIGVDKDYRVAWRSFPSGTPLEYAAPDYLGASTDAENYRLQSWLPIAGVTDLRAALDGYPAWITERYLEMPINIPPRVYRLAEELTAAETNAYDKASAIEAYLRTFEYNLDISYPPLQRDLVDYFLFDMQEGYCDYFATAMIVMARSLGIPSRLAVGYATGTFDQANQRFLVTEAEAHSWVEVYFPRIGWVPFEPTPGRPAIGRPLRTELAEEQVDQRPSELIPWTERLLGTWQDTLIRVPLVIVVLVVIWFAVDSWWLRQFPSDQTIERLYRRLYRHGQRLRVPARRGGTPSEFAANLEARLASLGDGSRHEDNLYLGIQEIRTLATTYGLMLFSPHPVTVTDQLLAVKIWMNLRRRLFLARFVQFRRSLSRKKPKVAQPQNGSPSESTE